MWPPTLLMSHVFIIEVLSLSPPPLHHPPAPPTVYKERVQDTNRLYLPFSGFCSRQRDTLQQKNKNILFKNISTWRDANNTTLIFQLPCCWLSLKRRQRKEERWARREERREERGGKDCLMRETAVTGIQEFHWRWNLKTSLHRWTRTSKSWNHETDNWKK